MNIEDNNKEKCNIKQFYYVGEKFFLEANIAIPNTSSVSELTQYLITIFNLPIDIEKDFEHKLKCFIDENTAKLNDDLAFNAIENAKNSVIDLEEVIKKYEKLFKEETVEYGEKHKTTDSEIFSNVYHKLVHSGPALQTMLQVEQSYALALSHILNQKEEQISAMIAKQTVEMDAVIAGVNVYNTEQDVNKLLFKHVEDQHLLQGRWNSEIDVLKDSQRKEYRDWLMKMAEEQQTTVSLPNSSLYSATPPSQLAISNKMTKSDVIPILEESFTIHLGSQMKQMHNIRIMSGDILDFCKTRTIVGSAFEQSPQRLQTALGLYSNDLCGLVLLKDKDDAGSLYDLSKEFYTICENSTEFHFSNVTDQLDSIKNDIKEAVLWRQSAQQCGNLTSSEQQSRRTNSKNLQPGDVFITRHSNLSNVHIVFHLIIDDSVKSNDINSRHAAILGLRNILKTACSNDVTTLTVPVLLMHEMTEEMTVAWCTKRAELMFKCMKGFMIEMATWGGSELKNLQFLVPKDISEEVFTSLATMLPTIFRVSNPLVFKASSTPVTPKSRPS